MWSQEEPFLTENREENDMTDRTLLCRLWAQHDALISDLIPLVMDGRIPQDVRDIIDKAIAATPESCRLLADLQKQATICGAFRYGCSDDCSTCPDGPPTQENCRAPGYQFRQEEIELNGQMVMADRELIPLLRALNNAGLITRSHCSGHEHGQAFVSIRADNINNVELITRSPYNELRIAWLMPDREK